MVVVSQESGVRIENGKLKMANPVTTKLSKTRDARNEVKRPRGEAVPLSPSDGERGTVRTVVGKSNAQQ